MRWTLQRPEIGNEDGFEKTDLFGYANLGARLANVIAGLEDDPIVVLDGGWGSGKTTFALQWAGLLRRRGTAVLYFDAFACDHEEDALLAFAEEVYCFAEKEGVAKEHLGNFAAKGAKAIKAASLAAVKSLGGNVLGVDITAAATEIAGVLTEESWLEAWISGVAARRHAVEDFRAELQRLAGAVAEKARERVEEKSAETAAESEGPQAAGRLVIVVDELDRCRPAFALSVLERVKHVFGVPGVTFVLVANLDELGKSVRSAYGEVDAEKYLEKFYDLVVRLPDARSAGSSVPKSRVYAAYLEERLLSGFRTSDLETHMRALVRLAEKERMSLRTMEHVVRNVAILALGGYGGWDSWNTLSVPVLVSVIRVVYPELFARIREGKPDGLEDGDWEKVTELAEEILFGANHVITPADAILDKSKLAPHSGLAEAARKLDAFDV